MEIYASVTKIHASVGRGHPCVASWGLTAPKFGPPDLSKFGGGGEDGGRYSTALWETWPLDLADFISKCPQFRLPLNSHGWLRRHFTDSRSMRSRLKVPTNDRSCRLVSQSAWKDLNEGLQIN